MLPQAKPFRIRLTVTRAVLLVAAVYLLSYAVIETRGFWIVDNANKFLQVQALLGSRFTDASLPWLGGTMDPRYEFNPLPPPFSFFKDGRLFSQYSLPFAFLSAINYGVVGWWGLYVIPLLATLLMLPGLGRVADALGYREGSGRAAVLMAALGTPLWFYALVFWEHAPAVCLGVWAVAFALRFLRRGGWGNLVVSSLLAAGSIWFRDEMYLFLAVLVVTIVFYSPGRRAPALAVGLLAGLTALAPLWWLQWKILGSPFGFHLETSRAFADGVGAWAAVRPRVFYDLFAAAGKRWWLSLLLTAPFTMALIVRPSFRKRAFGLAVPLALLAGTLTTLFVLAGYLRADSPVIWMLRTNSLFTASPLLLAAGLRLREAEGPSSRALLRRWLWLLVVGYAILYGLLSPADRTEGIHWGNRLLLVLYPLLAALAAGVLVRWWSWEPPGPGWRKGIVILAAAVSLGAQVWSLMLLDWRQDFSRRANLEIGRRPEGTVVTDTWWVSQELYSEFYRKAYFYAGDPQGYQRLLGMLAAAGRREILLVTDHPRLAPAEPVAMVQDHALRYFSLWFYRLELGPPG